MNIQKKVIFGLLILWVLLIVAFAIVRSGFLQGRVVVYFFKPDGNGSAFLVELPRQIKGVFKLSPEEKIKLALEYLISGPAEEEASAGYFSCVPSEAKVLSVRVENGIIYADFNGEIESGGGTMAMKGRLAQIVYTATQFNPEAKLRILIEGKEIKSFSGEGITDVEKPMHRADFSEFIETKGGEK